MANQNIFCSSPWYELQIYWDGSLGICCTERHKLYSESEKQYNIANMTIQDWFNSEPVSKFRQQLLGDKKTTVCGRCYLEESLSGNSRREKTNLKNAIFMQAFDASFEQSPARKHFSNSGLTDTAPVDMHIDLGNHCNLTCKMCNAESSSKIASQEIKWGILDSKKFIGQDWTSNQVVWDNFKQQLLDIPNLSNIHFMGGETLLSNRVEDLVDFLIEHEQWGVGFSFVTNGTIYKPELIKKMSRFKRVGIEISIETLTPHNDYIRQGTDTQQVMDNIARYQNLTNNIIDVTIRPAISALSIGTFWTLLQFTLDHQLVIKPNWCMKPGFLDPKILPQHIKKSYIPNYLKLINQVNDTNDVSTFNASDRQNFKLIVKQWAQACVAALESQDTDSSEVLQSELINHCKKWDQVYNFDARSLYPEFSEMFIKHGYVSS
jgi:molybdenum cofactor biosynthesis enzyme MoaA